MKSSRQEAEQIKAGLQDDTVRAFVSVMGILSDVPTDRARRRILAYVEDMLAEKDGADAQ